MTDFIKLPRSWLDPRITSEPDFLKAVVYLATEIDKVGAVEFSSGDALRLFGLSRRRYRTLLSILDSGHQTAIKATNRATNISLENQCNTTTKRPTRRPAKRPTGGQQMLTTEYVSPPYVDIRFAETWHKFMEYRKEIKKPYKSAQSEKIAYNKMVEMADHDPEKAKDMVERTILGQWQGLFPDKNNGTKQPTYTADGRKADRYSELENAANAILCRAAPYNSHGDD